MGISQEEVLARMSPEMRAEVEVRGRELIEEVLTLRDLRSAHQLTQKRVAELLGVQQDSVSRMERRTDMLLSTMSGYVEAMGGTLRLIAEFPNRRPFTVKLSDVMDSGEDSQEDASRERRHRKAAAKGKAGSKTSPKSKPKSKPQHAARTRPKAA
jgi:transcriptional regulator with XRE-family HTH domain